MYTKSEYTVEDAIVTQFVNDIIDEAMEKFNISFGEVSGILNKLGYWELFNSTEVTLVGAHEGIEPILKEIEGELREYNSTLPKEE